MTRRSAAIVAVLALVLLGGPARAHPLAPALLELRETASGEWRITWKVPLLLPPGQNLQPRLPPQCGSAGDVRIEREAEARRASWLVRCDGGAAMAGRVGVEGLTGTNAAVLLRVVRNGGGTQRWLLTGDRAQVEIAPERPESTVLGALALGAAYVFAHGEVLGVLVGLFLFARRRRELWLATGFLLVGQAALVATSSLGTSSMPVSTFEIGIAVGLLYVAAKLAQPQRPPARRGTATLALGLGLLCGAAVATSLRGDGLAETPLASLSFAAGFAATEVLLLCGVAAVAAALRRLPAAWISAVRPLPAYALGGLAVFWMLERVAALL